MSVKVISKTYKVNGPGDTSWEFICSDNGITIPGQYGHEALKFKNSKKQVVKNFHKALGEFLEEIDLEDQAYEYIDPF